MLHFPKCSLGMAVLISRFTTWAQTETICWEILFKKFRSSEDEVCWATDLWSSAIIRWTFQFNLLLKWFHLQSLDSTTKTILRVEFYFKNISSTWPEMDPYSVLTGSANIWSWHQPSLHLAHLWPISYNDCSDERESILQRRIPPLPSLTFPFLLHISLWEKKNRNIQWSEKSPDTQRL